MTISVSAVKNEQGVALLVVLWTLSLLALLTLSFAQNAWLERHRVRNLIDAAAAKAELQAGLSFGIAVLLYGDDTLGWSRDGTIYHMQFGRSDVAIALQDANGCLNINTAAPPELGALLQEIGLDQDPARSLAAAIVDWRDPDQLLTPNGAELSEYAGAGSQEVPANRPFLSTEELHGVLGMTPTIVDKLLPLVSVSAAGSEINRSTAPAAVLHADKSIPPEEVTAILARRANRIPTSPFGPDATEGTTFNTQPRTATQADLAETAEGPVFTVSVAVTSLSGAKAQGRAEIWRTSDKDHPFRTLNWYPDEPLVVPVGATP